MIHVSEKDLHILQSILASHPGAYVFGSRVKGNHHPFSDLDLCFIREVPLSNIELAELREACEQSDLPFKVDIVDFCKLDEEFQKVITEGKVAFPYKTM